MSHGHVPNYIMALDDPGDIDAAPGTSPWARAMRYTLYRLAKESTAKLKSFQDYLALIERHHGYQQLDDEFGHPFVSLKAFCVARVPFGLGYDPGMVEALQAETREMLLGEKVEEVRQLLTAQTSRGERIDLAHCSKLSQAARASQNGFGIHKQRKLDYLATHAPDLLPAVEAGTMSAHRAYGLAKGQQPLTPLDYLHKYWRQVSPDDRLRFLVEMLTPNERRALQVGYEEDATDV